MFKRFQEIAGALELSFAESISGTMLKSSLKARDVDSFQLWTTAKVWDCLTRCWKDGVFIHQLTHRFWKLSLQIIARFSVWIDEALNEVRKHGWQEKISSFKHLLKCLHKC